MKTTAILHNTTVQLVAGMLIGITAVAGIYVVLDASASGMGTRFTTAESTRHLHVATFTNAIARAAEEHSAASERCAPFVMSKRNLCNFEAGVAETRARADARMRYKDSDTVPAIPPVATLKPARNIDVVLYRAHRQWPD